MIIGMVPVLGSEIADEKYSLVFAAANTSAKDCHIERTRLASFVIGSPNAEEVERRLLQCVVCRRCPGRGLVCES